MPEYRIIQGDAIAGMATLPAGSVHCCVTSPPYWGLRDYGVDGQIGLEASPQAWVDALVAVFREVRRLLTDDGTLWVNVGDAYAGSWSGNSMRPNGGTQRPGGPGMQVLGDHYAPRNGATPDGTKPKDLIGLPWLLAFALRADGWYLRSDIIWSKPNPMPESVTDRPTKSHEYVFLLSKNARYFFDAEAVKEESAAIVDGYEATETKDAAARASELMRTRVAGSCGASATRNIRTVWTMTREEWMELYDKAQREGDVWRIATQPYPESHFATFPEKLVEPCILAGTSEKGCCPECGAPWVRQIQRVGGPPRGDHRKNGALSDCKTAHPTGTVAGSALSDIYREYGYAENRTVGWEPSCDCWGGDDQENLPPHQPVPCTVLDPFAGSGTTLSVALQHGRNGIGIELNPEYVALAHRRIGRATRPSTFRDDRAEDAPLFTGA